MKHNAFTIERPAPGHQANRRGGRTRKRIPVVPKVRSLPPAGRLVVIATEQATAAVNEETSRKLLQDAENLLLDPRASIHQRGDLAGAIAVHLAGDKPTSRRLTGAA